jgi:hypothetical protein
MTSQSYAAQGDIAPYTDEPDYSGPPSPGDLDDFGWQYLGVQDFFVAAKIAIFEESFVENTINVGNEFPSPFSNIVIAGGRPDPYIAVGQVGTQGASGVQYDVGGTTFPTVIGYNAAGVFMGVNNGTSGTSGTERYPMFSLVSSDRSRYLTWDGFNIDVEATNLSVDSSTGDVTVRGNLFAESGSFEGGVFIEPGGSLNVGGGIIISSGSITAANDIGTFFTLNSSGISISGSISATDGVIGGFEIGTTELTSVIDEKFKIIGSASNSPTNDVGIELYKQGDTGLAVTLKNSQALTDFGGSVVANPTVQGTDITTNTQDINTAFSSTGYLYVQDTSPNLSPNASLSMQATTPRTPQSSDFYFQATADGNVDINGSVTDDTYFVRMTVDPNSPRYITALYASGQMRVRVYEQFGSTTIWQDTGYFATINISYSKSSGFTDPFSANIDESNSTTAFSIQNVAVEQDKYYKLVTEFSNITVQSYTTGGPNSLEDMDVVSRTPLLAKSDVTVTYRNQPGDTFTEITDGGFQIKSGTTSYLRIPVSTQNTHWADIDIGGGTSISGQLIVTGSIEATGNITAFSTSDERLKDNLVPLSQSLKQILSIGGYEFEWNKNQTDFQGNDYGIVAQEVEKIAPFAVKQMKNGFYGVRYEKLIPFLIEAIKELSEKVEKLESKNKE